MYQHCCMEQQLLLGGPRCERPRTMLISSRLQVISPVTTLSHSYLVQMCSHVISLRLFICSCGVHVFRSHFIVLGYLCSVLETKEEIGGDSREESGEVERC
jgi:hypothetical protein